MAEEPRYRAYTSPRSLTTTTDHLRVYPQHWELMRWYLCWRKFPYPVEGHALLLAEGRGEEYSHYPCPKNPEHWHIGRGHNQAPKNMLTNRAKRVYRKAVRDEIWAETLERRAHAG